VPLPFRDAELLAVDHWLGFERGAYQAFLATHETLRDIISFAYGTMNQQNLLVVAVAVAMRKPEVLQTYVVAFAIAVTATAVISIFVPAANALIYVDKLPTDIVDLPNGGRSYFQALQGLRAGTLRVVDLSALDGLISFPSFHTASAILFVWVLWSTPIVRFVVLPLNVLLIAGTPLCGAHYLADIVGGAAVALGAIFVTSRLMDVKPRRAEAAVSEPLEQVGVLVVRGARGAGSGEGAQSHRSMSTERV
jgi:membrane-associated phospholipid phosphatase